MLNRRHLITAGALAAASAFAPLAQAQTTLAKPARILVGFPAGGAADAVARLLAQQLTGTYAPTVIVDNKPGAGGRIAAQTFKTADADGTQMLVTPASILTIYPHAYKKLGYDSLADFTPVGSAAKVSFAFSVSSAVPASVKTMADYVTWAKANPKEANFGSPAAGATPHFVGVMLGRAAGLELNHIPYKGGAPLVSDLLGGQVQAGVNVLPEVLPHQQAGKLRILAVSGAKRSPYLPGVPTLAESGFKDVAADEYFAVFVQDPGRRGGQAQRRGQPGPQGQAPDRRHGKALVRRRRPVAGRVRADRQERARQVGPGGQGLGLLVGRLNPRRARPGVPAAPTRTETAHVHHRPRRR